MYRNCLEWHARFAVFGSSSVTKTSPPVDPAADTDINVFMSRRGRWEPLGLVREAMYPPCKTD